MNADELIREELKKFPEIATMSLAKKLFKEHPALFKSLESARNMVRYRRGAMGKSLRKNIKDKSQFREPGEAGWSIPKSETKMKKPFRLTNGKWLVMSDLHIPYHDEDAIEQAIDYGFKNGIDNVILLGDVCDFFAVSRWLKDPEERNLSRELMLTRQMLGYIRQQIPNGRIVYKEGNHEERWSAYMYTKAPEICGVTEFEMRNLLEFSKWGIEHCESRRMIKAGKHLTLIHGHEKFGGSSVNPARGLFNQLGVCAIMGHHHQSSGHSQKNADDKFLACWSLGCLCDLKPDYAPINKWNHGFGILQLKGNDFHFENLRIINGQINHL